MVNVSWWEARLYCAWMGGRLPTEAEWEYACRAGTETPFSFGKNITPKQANYNGGYPYSGGKKGEYRERTVEVGSLPANPWGLHEMHGNVWEWCVDWFSDYLPGKAVDRAASWAETERSRQLTWLRRASKRRHWGSKGSDARARG